MALPVILSAARTAIGTARKGTLVDTEAEELAKTVLIEVVRRAGLSPDQVDDVVFAESLYGGGDIARHAAVEAGMTGVGGMAVNRHCAGSLTSVGVAAGSVAAGMDRVVVAGGVQSTSTAPQLRRRTPGTLDDFIDNWAPPSHPNTV